MKKSTIERRYTKDALADMLKVDANDYTKNQLVDMALPIFNEVEVSDDDVKAVDNVVKDAESAVGIAIKNADNELDNALEIVLKEGILYRINSHCWWGKTSRVPEDEIDVPKDLMTGVKTLIDPKHLGPFRQWKGIGERVVKKLGYSFLGLRGVYFVPKGFIDFAETKLAECQRMAKEEKENFIGSFRTYKEEWKTTVLALCEEKGIEPSVAMEYLKEEYYPSKAQLDGKFVFNWTKFAITVPDSNMGILTDAQYKEEVKKQKAQCLEFLENCVAELAQKFYTIISKIDTKLKAGDQIKPKTLQSLNSFTEVFDKMNITNNSQLAGYVEEARKMFSGVSVKDFKEEEFADKFQTKLEDVVTRFSTESDEKLLRDIDF